LKKVFSFAGKHRLELRVEGFNVFNHPNFGLPDNYFDSGEAFGTIAYTAIPMLQVQFGLRYSF
jgi:hypothetical protein